MADISIIIPLVAGEKSWKNLARDLAYLPETIEVLFVESEQAHSIEEESRMLGLLQDRHVEWIKSQPGRAAQLNAGARAATGQYLWFLNADARLPQNIADVLFKALDRHPHALHYFNLRFLSDGPSLIFLNEWGTKFRSYCFGMPYGDQGLCMSRAVFESVGGFPEDVEFGEDNIFVLRARQYGIKVHPIKATILASARKYNDEGWWNMTLRYQVLWLKQALPEWKKLMQKKSNE